MILGHVFWDLFRSRVLSYGEKTNKLVKIFQTKKEYKGCLVLKMYDIEFRRQVLKVGEEEGLSSWKLSARFGPASSTILSWRKRLEAIPTRSRKPTKITEAALVRDIEQYPDAYYHERAARLGVSAGGIESALKRLKAPHIKKPGKGRRTIYVLLRDTENSASESLQDKEKSLS